MIEQICKILVFEDNKDFLCYLIIFVLRKKKFINKLKI